MPFLYQFVLRHVLRAGSKIITPSLIAAIISHFDSLKAASNSRVQTKDTLGLRNVLNGAMTWLNLAMLDT